MNILFATIDFVENNGPTTGLPKYLFRTAKVLLSWGHDVTVVTCANRGVEYDFFGIHVHRVRAFPVKNGGNLFEDELRVRQRDGKIVHDEIERILKRKKIDIIQYASLSGLAFFHDFDIPAVMRLSSYAKMWPMLGKGECGKARSYMEREAARKCDAIFAPSIVVAKAFGKDIKKTVDVIETPFILETEEENDSLYETMLSGKKYILFYGTLVGYKGLQLIADVIHHVLDTYRDVYYVFIGGGDIEWINTIRKSAGEYAERVIYHSAVGFSELCPLITNARLITLPSQMENFSNACIESMALGNIVLGTNGASFEQLIKDKINGVLCGIDDGKSFIEAVDFVLGMDDDARKNMSEAAIKATERLRPEIVTKILLDYYRKVIIKQRGSLDVIK